MELSEVGRQDFRLSNTMMLEFINKPCDSILIGSYSYMLNCMYAYSLKILVDHEVPYRTGDTFYSGTFMDMLDKTKYSQCEVIANYLLYKDIIFNRDSLRLMITLRNRLVHEPRFIKIIKSAKIGLFPNYQEILKISNVFYGTDICGDYLKAITQFCIGQDPDGYVKNPDELPDTINSGLDKTNSEPDLMEQLMNQNKE